MTRDVFRDEISRQPGALDAAVDALTRQGGALARLSDLAGHGRPIVLTGMGSSYDACLAAASVLGSAGIPSTTVNTAELVHFRLPALRPETIVVAVSQSGRSAELVRLVAELASNRAPVRPVLVTVTNGLANQVAAAADIALNLAAGVEVGPATITFLTSCVVLAAVTRILAGAGPVQALAAVRDAAAMARTRLELLLADADTLAVSLAGWLSRSTSLILVGRGTALAAAEVGALVLKEAAGFAAECLDAAEFRHGPLEMAGPSLAVAIVATEPRTYTLDRRLAAELVGHGAAVLLLAPGPDEISGVKVVALGELDRLLAPGVAAVPFQLLAWRLAVARRRPIFTTASKVTLEE